MSIDAKADRIVELAQKRAERASSWSDFSRELFDQREGIVSKVFPDELERQAFFDSPQHARVMQIQSDLMKRIGVMSGAVSAKQKSGRFNVRIPRTLHQSLEIEAKREGVSLNQLALSKLALPLRAATQIDLALLIEAFADVHEGYASDRIVVDPDYNAKFLRRCRELGFTQDDVYLNHALFNIRKSKKQRDRLGIQIPPTTKKTEFRDFDGYQFAAEIAARVLQRTEGVSLDRILCDPKLAARFDEVALALVNETVLKLRWAAFNLRKTHKLKPISGDWTKYDLVSTGPVKSLDLASVADIPGLYAFYSNSRPVFAGETDDLRKRIATHIKYGIPCFDLSSDDDLILKTSAIPNLNHQQRLRWLMQFVNDQRPLLNYQKAA